MISRRKWAILESARDMESWDEMEPILIDYAKRLNVTIRASSPDFPEMKPKNRKDTLFVYFYASPSAYSTEQTYIEKAFGIPLEEGENGDAVFPSITGIPIYDPDLIQVGEICGGTLYIHFDLPHGPNAGALLDLIMAEYFRYADPSNPLAKEQYVAQANQKSLDAQSKYFTSFYDSSYKKILKITDHQATLRDIDLTISHLQKSLAEALRTRKILAGRESKEKDELLRQDAHSKFDDLVHRLGHERIKVLPHEIHIDLGQIDIEYDGHTYDMGEYTMILNYQDIDESPEWAVSCINRTRIVGGWMGIYVYDNGEVCFGNITEGIARLVADMEFVALVDVVTAFLQNAEGDKVENIYRWPIKKSARKKTTR